MKKVTTILPVLLLVTAHCLCQEAKPLKETKFISLNQAGLVSGSNGESLTLQTINGVSKNGWSAGIGVGIDFYVDRSVPLFLDVRKDLLNKNTTPFFYADGGVNFPWLNFIQREQKNTFTTTTGKYYDLGGGWKFKLKNKKAILLSAGYTFKQSKGKGPMYNYNPVTNTSSEITQYQDFRYRRLVIKVGFKF